MKPTTASSARFLLPLILAFAPGCAFRTPTPYARPGARQRHSCRGIAVDLTET